MAKEPSSKGRKPLPKANKDAAGADPAGSSPKQRPQSERPLPASSSTGGDDWLDDEEQPRGIRGAISNLLKQSPSWLTSMVIHVVVLLILGLLTLNPLNDTVRDLMANLNEEENAELEELPDEQLDEQKDINIEPNEMVEAVETQDLSEEPDISPVVDDSAAPPDVTLNEVETEVKALSGDLLNKIGAFKGKDLDGRGDPNTRKKLLRDGGGSEQSEKAVALALKWIAEHQLPDGSWSFQHQKGRCNGRCKNPGSINNDPLGATGLALLPFLGAGHTHKKSKEYKKTVAAGLYYLTRNMDQKTGGMNKGAGRMYSHGIAAIALCEAYAMTQDKSLRRYAQAGLNFIAYAQDPVGGGWRYTPHQPGDTSVVGWQLMALKSGKMGYLAVPPKTIAGANNFLNTVQTDSGSRYGYTNPGQGAATTAVGLLCRMYLGWKKDNGALDRGVEYLGRMGPSRNNMYFNYYATQVLHHWGGERWKKWNGVMRDFLVDSQDQQGHETGSWYLNGGHGAQRGGRLYTTCMCCMTLEVYYRHLPIYQKQSTEDEFDF